MAHTVTAIDRGELGSAARVLAAAFMDDPLYRHFLPRDADRASFLLALSSSLLGALRKHGAVLAAHDDDTTLRGVIGIVPPERYPLSLGSELRIASAITASVWWRPAAIGFARRAMRAWRVIGAYHPATPPHFYLCVVGVSPDAQGTGVGRALVGPALAQADARGQAFYLETANPQNLPFYRRFGFEVMHELDVGGGAPPVWTMVRAAVAPRDAAP